MNNLPEIFGSMVFNDKTMREKLPKETYKILRRTIDQGKKLDINIANIVANAMKEDVYKRQLMNQGPDFV